VLIPLALSPRLSDGDVRYKQIVFYGSFFGYFSLFPLLHQSSESVIKACIFLVYMGWLGKELKIKVTAIKKVCAAIAGVVWAVGEWYLWTDNDSFLPLMGYSIYCALGLGFVFVRFCRLVFEEEVDWVRIKIAGEVIKLGKKEK
jgi:hypothetical protein